MKVESSREVKKFEEAHIPRFPTQFITRSCIYVHAEAQDVRKAIEFCIRATQADAIKARESVSQPVSLSQIENMFATDPARDQVIIGLSVRSIWDNFLRNLRLPRGSEVLMTAINIPNMVQIVRFNNLVPVPVDIDFDELKPKLEDI